MLEFHSHAIKWEWEEIPGHATPLSYCATCTRTARCSRARMLRTPWMALTGCSWRPRWPSSSSSYGFRQIDNWYRMIGLWWWRIRWQNQIKNLKSMKTAVRSFSLISPTSSFREGKDNIEHPHQEGADVPIDGLWGGEQDVPLISAGHTQVKPHSPHITTGEDIYIQGVSGK